MSEPRVLALSASPRKARSRTAQLVEQVLAGARSAGAQTEHIDVCGLNIRFCTACDRCHVVGDCGITDDDFAATWEKVLAADGLVLASPVYIMQVSAQLKVLLDRMGQAYHCQSFAGKYGASVATSGSMGHEETATYMNRVMGGAGAQTVGHIACVAPGPALFAPEAPEMLAAEALGRTLSEAIRDQTEYPDQTPGILAQREAWGQRMVMLKDVWKWEYGYWQQKGWL